MVCRASLRHGANSRPRMMQFVLVLIAAEKGRLNGSNRTRNICAVLEIAVNAKLN